MKQKKAAAELGYEDTGQRTSKKNGDCKIFEKKDGNPRYISRDRTGHNGGAWKGASKTSAFNAGDRTGTYDEFLNWIKD